MAEGTTRISKIIKDYNIGMSTLVEFLKKKGIDVKSGPNEKISDEAVAMVAKEFGKEQLIKEDAKKRAITVKEITGEGKRDRLEDVVPEKELLVKSNTLTAVKQDSAAEAGKEEKSAPKTEAPKVAAPKVEEKQEPKTEMAKDQLPKVEETPAPKVEAPKVETAKAETPKVEAPKAESPKVEPPVEESPKVEEKPAPKVETPKIEEKPKLKAETPKVEVKAEPKPKAETPKKEEAPATKVEPESSYIETKVEKLAGPKTIGTLDLSKFEKKPAQNNGQKGQQNNNGQGGQKGKRERIHKLGQKVDLNAAGQNSGNKERRNGNQGGNGQNNGRNKGGHGNNRDRLKFDRTEVDSEAIQKQIRETYARMTEGKGKTKGSKHRREKRDLFEQHRQEEFEMQELTSNVLKVTEFVTANELAIMMNNTPVTKVIEACMNLGMMVSINQRLDAEALVLVAEEFGYKIEFTTADEQSAIEQVEDQPEDLVSRPPIITVMGHVDHGKTSLLDYIRKSNVIAGEAGGITQHIGAYNVKLADGRRITFLDTPGHEAFTAMRARGAKMTDIAIIIVAADDAVMPQTVEAINHAQAAGVPMVFAINKIDKPGANGEKIKEQLANMNILVEDWGGNYQCQEISAKKGINVDKLLDKVLLEADLLELKANPDKRAVGTVVESSLDKGRGFLATILVQSGTLRVGDIMLSGCYTGKVKAMFNERGQKIKEAGPSTPVLVLGLNGAPTAGDTFNVLEDEREAKEIANKREQLLRMQGIKTQVHVTLEEIGRRIAIGNFKELNIIIKADVDGSIEALRDSLEKLSTEEVKVNVIHKAVGAISSSDVMLAVASNAVIVGFNVRPTSDARQSADKEGIQIRLYSVIYDAINEVKDAIEGMLAPEEKEEVTATAEVRETFKISKVGTIAGCMVKDGKLIRSAKIRVIRDGIVVYTGTLGSLKRFKDDVKEVQAGYDCGLNIENFNDIKIGDVIEAYQIIEIKRTL